MMKRTRGLAAACHRLVYGVGVVTIVGIVVAAVYTVVVVGSGFSTRDRPSAVEAVVARTMRRLATPRAARAIRNPLTADSSVLEDARAHWADHCAVCHAADGSGDTAMGRNMYPPAPDMRADIVQVQTDGELYHAIQNGIRLTGMPSWGEPRDDDPETWALVALVRTLPTMNADELRKIEAALPRSPHTIEEEASEREFLRTP